MQGYEPSKNVEEKKVQQKQDLSSLKRLPVTYQEIHTYFAKMGPINPFELREETFRRIEEATKRPLLCYVTRTHNIPEGVPAYIEDSDLTGFGDLTYGIEGPDADIFIVSNGGLAETTERIVRMLRTQFQHVRFIVPANAFSAATLLCFSGNEIVMDLPGTLGPIDPQYKGTPTRVILRAFDEVKRVLKEEGPQALMAYMPLISKYDLAIIEICKMAEELSKELAADWLSRYMFQTSQDDKLIENIIDFFSSYDMHKSHGRSIDRDTARGLGLVVKNTENEKLADLVRSLYNQYDIWFAGTDFYKVFENAHGINWGRKSHLIPSPPSQQQTQPGPPQPTR
jgi:Serine dehydrogenase proteinase